MDLGHSKALNRGLRTLLAIAIWFGVAAVIGAYDARHTVGHGASAISVFVALSFALSGSVASLLSAFVPRIRRARAPARLLVVWLVAALPGLAISVVVLIGAPRELVVILSFVGKFALPVLATALIAELATHWQPRRVSSAA